jgi:signal transduction histidine kinase
LFDEGNAIFVPMERLASNGEARHSQAARTPAVAEFAASIASEIREPLSSVVLNAEAGLRWLTRDDPDLDEARHAVSAVAKEGMRAGEMIRGLLALIRQSQPVLATCDINDVIHDVVVRTCEERQRHGVLLNLDLPADNRRVFGSRAQLQQVVFNLVMNGIEAMSTVPDRPRVLTISLQPAERAGVLVAVGDTAAGVDPAVADCVFEPFFTTKPGAIGMGLSICRSIIEAYGGHIWTSPREVCGTVFRFVIPAPTDPETEE